MDVHNDTDEDMVYQVVMTDPGAVICDEGKPINQWARVYDSDVVAPLPLRFCRPHSRRVLQARIPENYTQNFGLRLVKAPTGQFLLIAMNRHGRLFVCEEI